MFLLTLPIYILQIRSEVHPLLKPWCMGLRVPLSLMLTHVLRELSPTVLGKLHKLLLVILTHVLRDTIALKALML